MEFERGVTRLDSTVETQPEWTTVDSSTLAAIAYGDESSNLLVRFKNGTTYQYSQVPKNIFDELMQAESKGKYFAQHIKGMFESAKVDLTAV